MWLNEPKNQRLRVEVLNAALLQFTDTKLNEHVRVVVPSDVRETMMTTRGRTITLQDAEHFVKGKDVEQRDVYHYINRYHAERLRAGLTIHHSRISSTPHGFELQPEPGFEEIFYFIAGGKGLMEGEGLWPDGSSVDAAWPVRGRGLASVPMGYHRVVALNGAMAYVWCYLCKYPRWEKD